MFLLQIYCMLRFFVRTINTVVVGSLYRRVFKDSSSTAGLSIGLSIYTMSTCPVCVTVVNLDR